MMVSESADLGKAGWEIEEGGGHSMKTSAIVIFSKVMSARFSTQETSSPMISLR
jgi:hypothetical protein